jgi:valyl-tRNA synthetase
MSVFDGMLDRKNEDIKYYYPTSDLVTGPDIIFFWVARMIMAGLEFKGEVPFKNVYFTGIVRISNVEKCLNHSEILLIQLN